MRGGLDSRAKRSWEEEVRERGLLDNWGGGNEAGFERAIGEDIVLERGGCVGVSPGTPVRDGVGDAGFRRSKAA